MPAREQPRPAGGVDEEVERGGAGLIVARDPLAIAEGVATLLAAPPAPETVAANAAAFSWDANAATLAEYYNRLTRAR